MSQINGVVIGLVVDVEDHEGQGRVKVKFQSQGTTVSNWAPIASPMGGKDRGLWLIPELDDEAVIAFEYGDVERPVILGFLWNGKDTAPSTAVRERMWRSVNGHTIRLIDSTPTEGGNKGGIAIEDAHGNAVVMTNGQVVIRSKNRLVLDAPTIVLGAGSGDTWTWKRVVTPNRNFI